MKSKQELQELSNAIGSAIRAYRKAIADNLKECGREVPLLSDDEDYNGIILKIRDDDSVDTIRVDKVRWNEERQYVEYHCAEWNYKEADQWSNIAYLGDDGDYILEAIDWEDEEPQPKNKVWTITKQSVYDFEDSGISTRVYGDKNVAQAEFDAMRATSREEDEEEEWFIDSDTDTYYEAYREGEYSQYHTLIYLEEHEI